MPTTPLPHPPFAIRVEAIAGSSREEVAAAMSSKSADLGVNIVCSFNGVDMYSVAPGESEAAILLRFIECWNMIHPSIRKPRKACPSCDGQGCVIPPGGGSIPCPACDGRGIQKVAS